MDTQSKKDDMKQKPVEIHEEVKKEGVVAKDASQKDEEKITK